MILACFAALAAPLRVAPSGHLLVQASIGDGAPGWFVLDSGASVTLLDPPLAEGLRVMRTVDVGGAGGEVPATLHREVPVTVDGTLQLLPYAVSMGIEEIKAMDPDVVGVLGMDVLRNHRVSIDRAAGTIDWDVPEPPERPLRLKRTRGRLLWLPLTLPDAEVRGVFDLGADQTVLNGPARASATGETALSQLVGVDGANHDTETTELAWCALGTVRTTPCEVTLEELSIFEQLGLHRKPAAIVGLNVLGTGPIVFDARQRKLWLIPVDPGAAAGTE